MLFWLILIIVVIWSIFYFSYRKVQLDKKWQEIEKNREDLIKDLPEAKISDDIKKSIMNTYYNRPRPPLL